MKKWNLLIFLATNLLFVVCALGSPNCKALANLASRFQERSEKIGNRLVDYQYRDRRLSSTNRERKTLFPDSENDVFIGFNGESSYFIFRDKRFEGGAFGTDNTLMDARFSSGLIIRIRNLSSEQIAGLEEALEHYEPRRALSCSGEVCSFLSKRANVNVQGLLRFSPAFASRSIVKNGIRDGSGDIMETEIYLINPAGDSLNFYLKNIPWDGNWIFGSI